MIEHTEAYLKDLLDRTMQISAQQDALLAHQQTLINSQRDFIAQMDTALELRVVLRSLRAHQAVLQRNIPADLWERYMKVSS